jgi:hypothetical protein
VRNGTKRTAKSIQLIQESLVGLAKGVGGLLRLVNGQAAAAAPGERRAVKRTLTLSIEVRALRKLQGTYMGYLRNLKPRQKTRVKALREAKGYPAAVKLARRLAAE